MKCERVAENIRPPSKDCYLRMKVTGNVVELLWQNHKSVAQYSQDKFRTL